MAIQRTVADVRQRAKDFLDRQGVRWDDAQFLRFINLANSLVYRAVAATDPSHLLTDGRITYPAETPSVDLTLAGYLLDPVYKVVSVALLQSNAPISTDNLPIPFDIVSYDDLHRRYRDGGSMFSDATGQPMAAMFCALVGNSRLHVAPPPSSDRHLHIAYVPYWRELTADGDYCLQKYNDSALISSRAVPFHDSVLALTIQFLRANEVNLELADVIRLIRGEAGVTEQNQGGPMLMGYEDPY